MRQRKIKNRIVFTAHATRFDQGLISEHEIHYQERKAKGSVGLIIDFGSASAYQRPAAIYKSISLWYPKNESYLEELANRVHTHGALLIS